MNWTKIMYVLIIVLLYVPMVFLGANVFFPEYTGANAHYSGLYVDCYGKYPYPVEVDKLSVAERTVIDENQRQCQEEFQKEQEAKKRELYWKSGAGRRKLKKMFESKQ